MADDAADRIELSLSVADAMGDVERSAWNAIANPPGERYDPFLDWDFLEAAESSGCAEPSTGWTPRHLLAHDPSGKLVGGAPLYLKTHSRGEFVFDHGWADALHRAGGRYYPNAQIDGPKAKAGRGREHRGGRAIHGLFSPIDPDSPFHGGGHNANRFPAG